MPLHTSKEFLDSSKNEYKDLLLTSEIDIDDFHTDMEDFRVFGFRHAWLHATFNQNIQWVGGSDDFNKCKSDLADFLNENMEGAYFVVDGAINTRSTLSVVILKDSDVQKFAKAYPEWKFDVNSKDRNAATLMKWKEEGRQLKDTSIYHYVFG